MMNLSPRVRDNETIEATIQAQLSGNLALKVFITFFFPTSLFYFSCQSSNMK